MSEYTKVVFRNRKQKDRKYNDKYLKIPKWFSETVNRGTDNTMAQF